MRVSIWPEWNRRTILRFFLLLSILIAAVSFTLGIRAVGKAGEIAHRTGINIVLGRVYGQSLGKTPQIVPIPTQLDALYGLSLMQQVSIGQKCQYFYKAHGFSPSSISELAPYGITSIGNIDPWGRPYRIHELAPQILIVQTTGPKGYDRVDWGNLEFKAATHSQAFMIDDNLLVVIELTSDGRLK